MQNNIFEVIKRNLKGRLPEILADLLPGGKVSGREYICASLAGGVGESCSTNVITGAGGDFATNDTWGDVIHLAAKVWHVPPNKAAKRLSDKYGTNKKKDNVVLPSRKTDKERPMKIKASSDNSEFTVIMPVPDSASLPFAGESTPSAVWTYRNAQGQPLFHIARYDKQDGAKVVRPRIYGRNKQGKEFWCWKHLEAPRPLYNLDVLANDCGKPVLVVEGEKTADKAQELLPDYVVITWSGGANAVEKSDWSPLRGRTVTIWPDNDLPGKGAAEAIRAKLPGAKVVVLPEDLPDKWDLADPIPKGFDIRQALEEAVAVSGVVIKNAATWVEEPIPPLDPIIEGIFDVGDKCFLIGGSKGRKSFFIMQSALFIAAGMDFLGMRIPKARRVVIAQLEIREHHYQRRLCRMTTAIWKSPDIFSGELRILNLRGKSEVLELLGETLKPLSPELLIIDPWYKLYDVGHDENSAGDTATLLTKIDKLADELGSAVMVVHHDNKSAFDGRPTGRGSGSGLVGRDYDACFLLTPHATEDAIVLSTINRNYPSLPDRTIRWHDYKFVEAPDIVPKQETATSFRIKNNRKHSDKQIIDIVQGWFDGSPIGSAALQSRIKESFMIGEKRAASIVSMMVESGNYSRKKNPETNRVEIIQKTIPETSVASQDPDATKLRASPRPQHSAHLIYKGAERGVDGRGRMPGTRRKTGI